MYTSNQGKGADYALLQVRLSPLPPVCWNGVLSGHFLGIKMPHWNICLSSVLFLGNVLIKPYFNTQCPPIPLDLKMFHRVFQQPILPFPSSVLLKAASQLDAWTSVLYKHHNREYENQVRHFPNCSFYFHVIINLSESGFDLSLLNKLF